MLLFFLPLSALHYFESFSICFSLSLSRYNSFSKQITSYPFNYLVPPSQYLLICMSNSNLLAVYLQSVLSSLHPPWNINFCFIIFYALLFVLIASLSSLSIKLLLFDIFIGSIPFTVLIWKFFNANILFLP